MVSQFEIQLAYRALLGREPESQSVIDFHSLHGDLESLCHTLSTSEEGVAYKNRQTIIKDAPFNFNRPVTIFIHAPKTGGVSILDWIGKIYGRRGLSSLRIDSPTQATLVELNQFDLVSGHFNYDSALAIPRSPKIIMTCLRDPVHRLVSLYKFYRSFPSVFVSTSLLPLARRFSPEEFFLRDEVRTSHEIDNYYLRTFSDYKGADGPSDFSIRSLLEQAIRRIDSLDAVAITERMDASTESIAQVLKFDNQPPPLKLNVTSDLHKLAPEFSRAVDVEITPRLLDIMQPLVCHDWEIYSHALRADFKS